MMIQEMSSGFAEHGHWAGTPALIVTLGETLEDGRRPVDMRHLLMAVRMNLRKLIYLYVRDLVPATAKLAAELHYRLTLLGARVAACVPPGVYVPCEPLAYESVLRVTESDIHDLDDLDSRVGSVSVHCWPGSPVMNSLTDLPSPHGRFLVLSGDDVGQAKVWLNSSLSAAWRIVHAHPLNEFEAAELCEMARL